MRRHSLPVRLSSACRNVGLPLIAARQSRRPCRRPLPWYESVLLHCPSCLPIWLAWWARRWTGVLPRTLATCRLVLTSAVVATACRSARPCVWRLSLLCPLRSPMRPWWMLRQPTARRRHLLLSPTQSSPPIPRRWYQRQQRRRWRARRTHRQQRRAMPARRCRHGGGGRPATLCVRACWCGRVRGPLLTGGTVALSSDQRATPTAANGCARPVRRRPGLWMAPA
jgi:hypothetical protein